MKSLVCALAMGAAVMIAACSRQEKSSETLPVKHVNTPYYYQRVSIFDSLPIDSNDIVMIGNSITDGCEWHELLDNPNVKNRGIIADVIQGVYDRLGPIVKGKPQKIFLMIGINDISHHLGVDSVVYAYKQLISHIRTQTPETQLFVESVLPVRIEDAFIVLADKEQQIRDVNTRISASADSLGFTWINLYDEFVDEDGRLKAEYTNDGLHLLAPGYLKWRDCILPYVSQQ